MRRSALVFALAMMVLVAHALADDLDPRRDANLAHLDSFCLQLSATSTNAAVLTEWLTETLTADLVERAAQAGVRLHAAAGCPAAEPTLRVAVTVHDAAVILSVQVVLSADADGYALPVVWSESAISVGSGIHANDVRSNVLTLFGYFTQAWQRQHGG